MNEISLPAGIGAMDSLLPFAPSQLQPAAAAGPGTAVQTELLAFFQLFTPAIQGAIRGEITPLPATSLQVPELSELPADKTASTEKKVMEKREKTGSKVEPGPPIVIAETIAPLPPPILLPWSFSVPSRRVAESAEPVQASAPRLPEDRQLPPQIAVNPEPIAFAARLTEELPVPPTEPVPPLGIHLVPNLKAPAPPAAPTIETEKSTIGFVPQKTPAAPRTVPPPSLDSPAKVQNEPKAANPVQLPEKTKRTQGEPAQASLFQPAAAREPHAPAEAAPQPVPPAKPAPLEHTAIAQPAPAPIRSTPVREISLKLPDRNGGTVEVQIVERGGKVNVIVRTPDTNLSNTLRAELTNLVRAVHEKGYEIETWTPPETRPQIEARGSLAADPLRGDPSSTGSGHPQNGGGQNGGNQQQRRQQRPEWLLELERRLKKEG